MTFQPTDLLLVQRGTAKHKATFKLLKDGVLDSHIIQSPTAPTIATHPGLVNGTIWVDTSKSPPELNAWDATAGKWAPAGGSGGTDVPPASLPGSSLVLEQTTIASATQLVEISVAGGAWADTGTARPLEVVSVRWKAGLEKLYASGTVLTEKVTFTKVSSGATKEVTYTLTITYPALTQLSATTIGGVENVGSTLTATPGTVTNGVPGYTYTTRWQRSDDGVGGWLDIAGANAVTYQLVTADGDKWVRAVTTASDSAFAKQTLEIPSASSGKITATLAPDVGTVTLSDVAGGNRFTSTAFPVAVTMTEEGVPASTKGMKAKVQGTLLVYPTSAPIINVGAVTGLPLTDPAAWTNLPHETEQVWPNYRQIIAGGNNTYYLKTTYESGSQPYGRILRLDNGQMPGEISNSDAAWQNAGDFQADGLNLYDAAGNWVCAAGQRNGNNYQYVCASTNKGSSWDVDQVGVNSGTALRSASDRGCSPSVWMCVVGSNGSNSRELRRYVNGSRAADFTLEQDFSSWGQYSNGRWTRTRKGYWLFTGTNNPQVSTNDGASFQLMTTLGLPALPTHNDRWCINGDVWLVNHAQNKAYVTDDFANYSERPLSRVGWANGLGTWKGWGFTYLQRTVHGSGGYDMWVSLDHVTWHEVRDATMQDTDAGWSCMVGGAYDPVGTPPNIKVGSQSAIARGNASTLTLTFADSSGLSGFANPDPVQEVDVSGSSLDAKGQVLSVDSAANTMTLTSPTGTFDVGSYVRGPKKSVANTNLYCVLDSNGNVTDLRGTDPGFVTQTATPTQVSFPATLPSGNPPDTDLPNGTNLTVEVQATNTAGTDSSASNTITPAP